MTLRPKIFISSVTGELAAVRDVVAKTLQFMGYDPVWQDIFGTDQGDLCAMLRRKINRCAGIIQLVGYRYGAEPPNAVPGLGRVSYTQYEALYAKKRSKKVYYFIDITPPSRRDETEERQQLQDAYREKIKSGKDLYHEVDLTSDDAVKVKTFEIQDKLEPLRRQYFAFQAAKIALILLIIGLLTWLIFSPPLSQYPITDEAANASFIGKDYATAFDIYTQLSDSDPQNIDYHRSIEECARLGKLEKPFLDRYLALVQRQPDNANFHNYLGNAYLLVDPSDKDGKAREQYETAIRLDPSLPSPLANLGILAFRTGKTEEAESLFKRYLEFESGDAQGWVNLGLLYVSKVESAPRETLANKNAELALNKSLELDPGSPSAYKGLGRLRAATGRKSEALDAYQRSLALNYEQPEVRQQVELLAWEVDSGRLSGLQADDLKTRGIAGDENGPAVLVVMRYIESRDYHKAELACEEWIEADPENPLAWRLLGIACEGLGQTNEESNALTRLSQLLGAKF